MACTPYIPVCLIGLYCNLVLPVLQIQLFGVQRRGINVKTGQFCFLNDNYFRVTFEGKIQKKVMGGILSQHVPLLCLFDRLVFLSQAEFSCWHDKTLCVWVAQTST